MKLSRALVCLSIVSSVVAFEAYTPIANAAPPDTGLVAYYQFNGNANDSSANGYHGTPTGVSFGADRFGNASSAGVFAGSANSHVVVGGSGLNLGLPFTVSVWVNFAAGQGTQNPRIFSTAGYELTTDTIGASRGISMNINGTSQGATISSGSAVAGGIWNQIVGVWSGQSMDLYLNGNLSASLSTSLIPSYSRGYSPTIGANSRDLNKDMFAGRIDDLRIYNRALSGAEMQQLFLTEVPEPSVASLALSGLVALFVRTKHRS